MLLCLSRDGKGSSVSPIYGDGCLKGLHAPANGRSYFPSLETSLPFCGPVALLVDSLTLHVSLHLSIVMSETNGIALAGDHLSLVGHDLEAVPAEAGQQFGPQVKTLDLSYNNIRYGIFGLPFFFLTAPPVS